MPLQGVGRGGSTFNRLKDSGEVTSFLKSATIFDFAEVPGGESGRQIEQTEMQIEKSDTGKRSPEQEVYFFSRWMTAVIGHVSTKVLSPAPQRLQRCLLPLP